MRSFIRVRWVVLLAMGFGLGMPAAAHAAQTGSPHGQFKEECALCHSPQDWRKLRLSSRFDHGKYGMPLAGAHATTNCQSCHHSLEFDRVRPVCVGCHEDPHRGENGSDCAHCHGTRSFTDRAPMVRMHQLSEFPLTGAHASTDCESCHKPTAQGQMQFKATSTACASCHMDNYRSTKNPDHVAMGYPTNCKGCHTSTAAWAVGPGGGSFDHSTTGFALTGAHAAAACVQCHGASGSFSKMSTSCIGCHQNSTPGYSTTTNPPHSPDAFGTSDEACTTCHNTTAWKPALFQHPASFALANGHAGRACEDCHKGNYVSLANSCYGCHQNTLPGYANATNPIHVAPSFGTTNAACTGCHNTGSWSATTFTHPAAFPLTLGHAGRTCVSCHGDAVYANKSTDCFSCHENSSPGYRTASNPLHDTTNFPPASCTTCHNTAAWRPAPGFVHPGTFALKGSHALSARQCADCHNAPNGGYSGTSQDCYSCHADNYAAATPPHTPASFPTATATCTSCHAQAATNFLTWANGFDHASVGFATVGQHSLSVRQCADCHNTIGYTAKAGDKDCVTCHLNSTPGYNNTGAGNPVHNTTYFPTATAKCTSCHAAASTSYVTWAGGTYTHTTMPLTNAHAGRACEDCHKGNYTTVAYSCYGCHQNPIGSTPGYATATSPVHTPTYFPTSNASCTGCHNTTVFSPSLWPKNHSTTAFAASFAGVHATTACTDCHSATTWATAATGTNCIGCHSANYAAAQPPHDPVNYPQAGCTCHNLNSWANATAFDHNSVGFPLSGAHSLTSRQCADCHNTIGYTAKSTDKDCVTCHLNTTPGYNNTGAGNPVHNTTYFPTATANCTSCHASAAASFNSWAGGTYTHTTMPLTNAHAGRACEDCHKGNYTTVAYSCYGCHQNPIGTTPGYATATNPTHTPTYFPTSNASCTGCHNTTAFSPSLWPMNHSTTAFAASYNGAHVSVSCTGCHNATTWSTLTAQAKDCYSCHSANYASAQPPHDPVNYPQAGCACHTTTDWASAAFDHSSVGFPTIGQHSLTVRQCADCHTTIGYTAKSTDKDCVTCHLNTTPGYNSTGAANPVHNTTYFPTATANCTSCHASAAASFNSWSGGTYTHSTMQLTNAHAGRACEDCHKGNYTSVAYSCYGCHQNPIGTTPGYATATNPTHTPAYFPTDNANCQGCHSTTAFSPSLWPMNHSTTPFAASYNGAHPALACTQCHNATTWTTLTTQAKDCYSCHASDYASAQPTHDPVNYPQAGCTCHTTSNWTSAGFDHSTVGFPTTGQHALTARACADCHAVIGYTAKSTDKDCITCHANSSPGYNNPGSGVPVHSTQSTYFPSTTTQCITCHATANSGHNSWSPGTFPNHTWFPITSGNHAGIACMNCHNVTTNLASYSCAKSCHTSQLNNHPQRSGFSLTTVETQCYNCHPSGRAG